MKICFIAGANSIHSHRWVRYFAERNHEIHWILLGNQNKIGLGNISSYLLKRSSVKSVRVIKYIMGVRKLLNEIKPQILHVHQVWIDGIIADICHFHPYILTVWGSDVLLGSKSIIKRPFIQHALKAADLVTCDAIHMKEKLLELGVNKEKIRIINFGVDVNIFKPGEKNLDLACKLNILNSPVIISLRSLNPIYDVITLIRAVPLVLKRNPKAKFIIVGEGIEREKLFDQAKTLGVLDSIIFTGFISNELLPEYINLSDIYVST